MQRGRGQKEAWNQQQALEISWPPEKRLVLPQKGRPFCEEAAPVAAESSVR